jgi:hypothetical protein
MMVAPADRMSIRSRARDIAETAAPRRRNLEVPGINLRTARSSVVEHQHGGNKMAGKYLNTRLSGEQARTH